MNIVITGASRGIGKALAKRFVKENHSVGICSLHQASISIAEKELKNINPDVQVLAEAIDVRDKSQLLSFAKKVEQHLGTVDVLINNAGIFIPGSIFEEEDGILENTLATNLTSAYYLSKFLLPKMIQAKKGHIFNLCSTASLRAYPNGGSYSISKHALLGFSRNLREEMKPFHIKVTAVFPGPTLTDSWAGFEGPADRMMKADDIAHMVYNATQLSPQAVVEDIVLRPMLGDIS